MFLLTRDIKWWENGLAQNFTSSKGKGGQASSVGVLVAKLALKCTPEVHNVTEFKIGTAFYTWRTE